MSLRSYLSRGTPESSKRLIAFIAAVSLCAAVLAVAEAIVFQAHMHWAIDAALVTAFIGSVGLVAALAQQLGKNGFNDGEPPK